MADDFLGDFLGSAVRAKILRAFVFEKNALSAIQAGKRSGVSTSRAEDEIRALEKLGMLKRAKFNIVLGDGKRVVVGKQKASAWCFNAAFKHAAAISKFVHEVSPMHYKNIVMSLRKAGRIQAVVLSGTFVGDDSRPADLLVAGDGVNDGRLEAAVKSLEPLFGREIRYASFSTPEFRYRMTIQDRLLRETLDFPHLVLLDKTRLL